MKQLLFITVFVAGVWCRFTAFSQNSGDYYTNKAQSEYKSGNYKQAISDFTSALPYYKNDTDVLFKLYFRIGANQDLLTNYKEAINAYNSAIFINPNDKLTLWNRGDDYAHLGQYQLALNDYNLAIHYFNGDWGALSEIYSRKALCNEKLEEYDNAIYDDSIALTLNQENGFAYWTRGNCYKELGKYDAAIKDIKIAINYYKSDTASLVVLYNTLGDYLGHTGNIGKAIDAYTYSISINPKVAQYYYNRALAYEDTNDFKNAINDYNTAIILYSTNKTNKEFLSNVYCHKAIAEEWFKQYEDGVKDASEAISIYPTNVVNYFYRGRLYLLLNRKTEATSDFNNVLRADIDTLGIPYLYSLFFTDSTSAINIVQKRIAANDFATLAADYLDMASFMALMNKPAEAISYLKKIGNTSILKVAILYNPDFNSIRNTPEFIALTK